MKKQYWNSGISRLTTRELTAAAKKAGVDPAAHLDGTRAGRENLAHAVQRRTEVMDALQRMLILIPGQFYAPTGIVMTPLIATLAQAHGATLIGFGTAIGLARGAERKGLIAVLTGILWPRSYRCWWYRGPCSWAQVWPLHPVL